MATILIFSQLHCTFLLKVARKINRLPSLWAFIYSFINVCARIRVTKIYRLEMIIFPVPIIHCYLYKYPLTVCIYMFNQMYLLHFKDILIILIRQTTNTTDSKQVHLNTHTAWIDRVQSRHYVSFNGTDVLYHVSSTTSLKWKHRTVYKCSTIPCLWVH